MNNIELQSLNNEYDMLKGNINRMFVTDDYAELLKQYSVAISRLTRIYEGHKKRFEENEKR